MSADASPRSNLDLLVARLPDGLAKQLIEGLKDIGSPDEIPQRLAGRLAERVDVIEQEAQDAPPEVA